MNVKLCFTTKDTPKGKIRVCREMTMKEAKLYYKTSIEKVAITAYIKYFDGWRWAVKLRLKGGKK